MRSAYPTFTAQMRSTYTILAPMMAPIQFNLLVNVLKDEGYTIELLTNDGPEVVRKGLKYVHNDTCYPALLVIGQMIDALDSGIYDNHRIALAITQTGGGCRASNYIHLLRKALVKAGYGYVPVLSLNLKGMDRNSGFRVTVRMLRKGIAALIYGDALMLLRNQCIPYEHHPGSTDFKVNRWVDRLSVQFRQGFGYSRFSLRKNLKAIVTDFAAIGIDTNRPVVKVGIVGEIYMKYAALGNNHLEQFLHSQSCEVMIPGIMGFVLYGLYNQLEDINLYGGSRVKTVIVKILLRYVGKFEHIAIEAIRQNPRFIAPIPFEHTVDSGREVLSLGCKMGEGWLLTAEMRDLAKLGYHNIICVQPFGCLPNHIVGKGMIHKLKELDERSNIVPIDYDPGASRVNQENRIKLMLSVANENRLKASSVADRQRISM
ncbi:MAG: 2-hydroxyacyl-CoA dehydratase [Sphaerochaetaceae bacterium]|jgi:predicted nucleotide-binding protein (sugar kinase/HSP70/actin superfamily)|nr:2-hydroxyacyl-CoA dehydratase [Sphaerochaetaceae bacterium]NLO61665.1 2-hydroxyglutaryl-CoA dehydratase [Spirochaetales bacterium]MDD3670814.1 2-hydroxyacyl-CoA dehydratase [Sphaerochaetaceae bacterium]MDD4258539.1 2-hydroxyacyl-CoA dehydratase [Sphaerochaetaceae bacterium]MDD4840482.1 2-hydroxyacyl-CoA dehydratase [Sphaerochaetaceae bacterium]